jgi:hypothetical protein
VLQNVPYYYHGIASDNKHGTCRFSQITTRFTAEAHRARRICDFRFAICDLKQSGRSGCGFAALGWLDNPLRLMI